MKLFEKLHQKFIKRLKQHKNLSQCLKLKSWSVILLFRFAILRRNVQKIITVKKIQKSTILCVPKTITWKKIRALKMVRISQQMSKPFKFFSTSLVNLEDLWIKNLHEFGQISVNNFHNMNLKWSFSQSEIQWYQFWKLTGGLCQFENSSDELFTNTNHSENS